jgi:tyrosyl-tRNA synthetase
MDVMLLAQNSTIQRGLRSMQEIARDVENATISQLWYPLMQVTDIKHLGVNIALGGMEQRKVHMIGKDMSKVMNYDFVALHTPLITSLKGPGQKMSKSLPGSGISITDSYNEIKKTINGAYCPEGDITENPLLQIMRLIIFPKFEKVEIKRPDKFGGNLSFSNYSELEKIYSEKKLHPLDLKVCTLEYLEKIIAPIRKNYEK